MAFFNFGKKDSVTNESLYVFEKERSRTDVTFKSISVSETEDKFKTNITKKLGDIHPFDYAETELINNRFGIVSAMTDKVVDFTLGPGIFIECEDQKGKQILDDWIEDTNLTTTLKPFLKEALVKGTGFMEIAGANQTKKGIRLKNINASTMFIKRDKKGKLEGYNQFTGSFNNINEDDIINFKPNEVMVYPLNKSSDSAYGLGRVFPANQIIINYLSTQKSLHRIVKRKSSNPVHVKMGDIATKDYPTQGELDDMSKSLQFMDDRTEWVTGPNIDIKGIDFGNFGDKFQAVLDNDFLNISTAFQVPEVLLGKGSVAEGLADTQIDGFERMIKSIQGDLSSILEVSVFNQILEKNGLNVKFTVKWGEQSLADKLEVVTKLSEMIKNPLLTNIMRVELEKQISGLLGLDIEQQIQDEAEATKEEQKAEREREEKQKLPLVPGQNSRETIKGIYNELLDQHAYEHMIKENVDITVREWIDFNIEELEESILAAIKVDEFKQLRAVSTQEIAAGYLNKRSVEKLRDVLTEGFAKNQSIKQIEKNILEKVKIKDLVAQTADGVDKTKMLVTKKVRANAIARTETIRLANIGALDNYKGKNVERVRIVASLTDRTCSICEGENGRIYPITEAYGLIPFHVRCRCTTSPVVEL